MLLVFLSPFLGSFSVVDEFATPCDCAGCFYYSGKAARGKFSVAFFFVIFRVAIGYARMRSASISFSG